MNRESHFLGISLTVLLHLGFGGLLFGAEHWGWLGGPSEAEASDRFKNARVIEAGLARKKIEKKSRQPQKQKKKKFLPNEADKVSRDDKANPADEKKNRPRVEPDEVDIEAVIRKNRSQDDDLSSTGSEEVPQEGSDNGSEWGTEKDARGDPYVGELKGRIYSVWKVPSLETGSGKVLGCVRLEESGKITEREVVKKSKNANLNRSVYLALKTAPDMDDPVPGTLKKLLTVDGICIEFNLDN